MPVVEGYAAPAGTESGAEKNEQLQETEHLPSLSEHGRISGLDALRGLAALGVVLTHFTSTYFVIYRLPKPQISVDCGREAVHLFFIISGFVILMTLDRSKRVADFAVSRFARLFPVFWACVGVTYIVVHLAALPNRQTTLPQALLNLSMMPSFVGAPAVDVVYWTLTIELCFYIVMAAILGFRLRRYLPGIVTGFIALGIIDYLFNLEKVIPNGGYRLRHLFILEYWHLFFLGIIIYELRRSRQWWHLPGLLLCAGVAFMRHGGLGGGIVCAAAALVYMATTYTIPVLSNRVLLYLGMISYALYLVHANVGYVVLRMCYRFGAPHVIAIPTAIAVVIALASALCFLIERPANAFLRSQYKIYSARRPQSPVLLPRS